ncbi:integrase catalytic domain-containing protein [Trichonephila clavipes]|nr:integrase catalytic domain-containing protein [Trichonephila clavipes]
MLKKLDNESRKNFELSLKAKDVPIFDEFIAFLEQRETILLSVDKNCIVETKTILRKSNLSFKTKTNLLMNRSVENKSCIVCKDKTLHPIFRCKRFLELNPEKRLDLVRLHKLCKLCLRKNHKRMQCTSTYVCPCGKKHSRSLCTAAIDDRKKWVIPSAELPVLTNPEDRESNVVDSFTQNTVLSSTASQHRKNVLISTGSVFLRNNEGRELKCPVIFDSAETEFGWIAGGRLQGTNTNNFSCYFLKDNDSVDDTLKLFFELESLGIKDDPCYRKDDQAMNIFKETVQYNNNRYVVELLFRKHWNELSNNISVAKQRFQSLWGRLRRDKTLYTQYKETIQDYLNQGIIEKVNDTEINVHKPMYYLPHQAIKKEGRVTTSTRIVFDAASHQANELSLNDCLWPGPNLNPNFLDVLINFRLNRVAISSDIRQAFFFKFAWRINIKILYGFYGQIVIHVLGKAHFASL